MDIIHRGLADIIDRQAQKINELQAKLDKAVEALKSLDDRCVELFNAVSEKELRVVTARIANNARATLKELGVE